VTEFSEKPLYELVISLDHLRRPVRSQDRQPGPYPYYGASGVVDSVSAYLFDGLHLLIAEDGENLKSRKTPVAFLADGKFWVNNHAHVVTGNERADTRYLSYAVEASDVSGYLTGSTQPKLTKESLMRLRVPAPPLSVQRAIAAVLGALDDKIESNRRVWALASSLIRSEYEASIRDGQTRSCNLADVCVFNASTRKPGPPSDLISYIDISSVGSGTVTGAQQVAWADAPSRARRGVSDGDIIFSTVRPARMAFSVMIDPTPETVVSTGFAVMTPRNVPMTLLLALVSHSEFGNFCESVSQGSAYPAVSPEAMGTFPVEIPMADRLEQFGDRTEPVVRRAYAGTLETQTLVELRDALLPELLSGRLRVRDAEKVVEETV
jgi:type I restriction enzyme S subunit